MSHCRYNGHPMAKKKEAPEESGEGVLASAAKTIGKAVGTVAAAVGVTPKTPSSKVPKLAKKNKNHLPRREKKAQRKAANLL
jgi:hypothetical protein